MAPLGAVTVVAHGFADAGAFPVPMPLLLGVTVAAAVSAGALPSRAGEAVPPAADAMAGIPATALRLATVALLVLIAVPAALGRSDVAANPAPQLLFTVGWAGLLLLSSLIGGWWRVASPLRWAAGDHEGVPLAGPGVWPAVVGLVAFSTAEQVLDPTPLLVIVVLAVYIVAGVGGILLRGGRWAASADPLEVASDLVGSIAPLGRRGEGLGMRSPRSGAAGALAAPGVAAFLGVLIGVNLFDAASGHGAGGDPLLFAAWIAGSAAVVLVAARPAYLAVAFIPAAAGHLAAHYLAPLLIDTQVAAVQASDPLGLGWNLLGLTGREIVAEPVAPVLGMGLQLLFLVAGHALAVVVAGDAASRRLPARSAGAAAFPARAAIVASLAAGVYLRMG